MFQSSTTFSACLITSICLFATGCGGNDYQEVPIYPLSGSLFVNGMPAHGAYLTFHPGDNVGLSKGNKPFARVGEDGVFQVTTYDTGDGAPAGSFQVTVYWPEDPNARGPSPDRLRGKFASPENSPLTPNISATTKVLDRWDLEG